jgi:hypothetical protein
MATKLNNEQKMTIQNSLVAGVSAKTIAKELNVPFSAVQTYVTDLVQSISKMKDIQKKLNEKTTLESPLDMMVTKTERGKKGVAIMTQTASERFDAAKDQLRGDGGKAFMDRHSTSVGKIRPNKD